MGKRGRLMKNGAQGRRCTFKAQARSPGSEVPVLCPPNDNRGVNRNRRRADIDQGPRSAPRQTAHPPRQLAADEEGPD